MFKELVDIAIRNTKFTNPKFSAEWDKSLGLWIINDGDAYLKIRILPDNCVRLELVNITHINRSISRTVLMKNVSSELSKWFRDRI